MNEQEFIEKEQAKLDKKLLAALDRVHYKGEAGRATIETLLVNGLVELSPPRPGFLYNHYKLTDSGTACRVRLRA